MPDRVQTQPSNGAGVDVDALETSEWLEALDAVVAQLGHSYLGITSIYLQGIDNAEIIDTVHARRAPMVQVNALLRR